MTSENQGDTRAENVLGTEKSFLDTTSSESILVNPAPTAISGLVAASNKVTKDFNAFGTAYPTAAAACVPTNDELMSVASCTTTTTATSNNTASTDFIQNIRGSPAAVKMERYVMLQDGSCGNGPRSNNTATIRAPAHHQAQISSGDVYPSPTKNYRLSSMPEESRLSSNIINNN
ncbi:unnamed protein product, partial [Allacma fusca]